VTNFRSVVQLKYDKPNYLKDIPSGALLVYKNKQALDKRNAIAHNEKEEPLKLSRTLVGLGEKEEEALIVVVPSPSKDVNSLSDITSNLQSTAILCLWGRRRGPHCCRP
jgi:hypothetical protein